MRCWRRSVAHKPINDVRLFLALNSRCRTFCFCGHRAPECECAVCLVSENSQVGEARGGEESGSTAT